MKETIVHPTTRLLKRFGALLTTCLLVPMLFLFGVYSGTSGLHSAAFSKVSLSLASIDIDHSLRGDHKPSISVELSSIARQLGEISDFANENLGLAAEKFSMSSTRTEKLEEVFFGIENSLKSKHAIDLH